MLYFSETRITINSRVATSVRKKTCLFMEYLKFSYILIRPKAKAKDVFLKLSKVLKDIKMSLVPKYNEVTLYRSRKR